jgi:hypothetical protein
MAATSPKKSPRASPKKSSPKRGVDHLKRFKEAQRKATKTQYEGSGKNRKKVLLDASGKVVGTFNARVVKQRKTSYEADIRKVLNSMDKNTQISKNAMNVLNSFVMETARQQLEAARTVGSKSITENAMVAGIKLHARNTYYTKGPATKTSINDIVNSNITKK